ncbi:hypothetical protein JFV30_30325 [Pseudomonas sp. TH32]|uniref:hypothetical protein n=1 Tax=Pseudomonas sp. TH32 TaxID=2796397 RepID=UPI0019117B06|nr:hypothetical protein [Pseudomonas sp. TH32]MBK5440982.1 hypothetical protein [Pseudomonas sp. TH32]
MNLERTQHIGHYGVTFTVVRFSVVPGNRHTLANICLSDAGDFANDVHYRLTELYEKMLAGDLPCKMTIAISKPLTRPHADLLNERGSIIALLIGGALAAPIHPFSRSAARMIGTAVGLITNSVDRSYHAGDVVIGMDAQVEGGIGPQHSLSAMVIPFQGG